MTAGYILVLVMLLLGGVIATLSDRLGTKVGKARLSLFNLRPRNTAVLVTVVTGSILSAITLTVLFAASKPLRTGVFQIDEIQKRLYKARRELEGATVQKNQVEAQKKQVEAELAKAKQEQADAQATLAEVTAQKNRVAAKLTKARQEQADAQAKLDRINQSLQAAIAEQAQTEIKLNTLRGQLNRVEAAKAETQAQLSSTQGQLQTVSRQKRALGSEIRQLQAERQQLIEQREQVKAQIAQRDQDIAQRDREITQRDRDIAQRDRKLVERNREIAERDAVITQREALLGKLEAQQEDLEQQQVYLQQQLQILERDFQAIREGNVAIRRGQILAAGVVRILDPTAARQAIDQLLQEANRETVQLLQLHNGKGSEPIIQITQAEVEQLTSQIADGQDYVVRILASANYLVGEKRAQVFANAEINRVVFRSGDLIAGTSVDPSTLTDEQVRQRLQKLIEACQFRARLIGIVGGKVQIADDRIETLVRFIERLQQHEKPVDVQALAAGATYTAGPLKVDLVALENGQVVFRTGQEEPGIKNK